jgi:hypothetical protein
MGIGTENTERMDCSNDVIHARFSRTVNVLVQFTDLVQLKASHCGV